MNYFYFFFFLFLSALIWVKPLMVYICEKVQEAKSLNVLGSITFLIGSALVIFFIQYDDWSERLWTFVTVILGFLLCLRGLVIIFYLDLIKKLLPLYIKNYYKFTFSISLILISLSFLIVSSDYIGEQKDISDCKSDGVVNVVCDISNPEDIVITPDQKFLLISEFGGISPYQETRSGGFALLRISDNKKIKPKITFEKNIWGNSSCTASKNKSFGPHGIDLIERIDGRFQFGVINHYPNESIEMFELASSNISEGWDLIWRGCIDVPNEFYFNDIALNSDGSFYASHMYSRNITMREWLMTSLFKSNSGYIVKWLDNDFNKVPSSDGSGPNGITHDASSNMLFISYNQGDEIVKFDLSINKKVNRYFVQSPDNIFLDKGSAWFTSLDFQPSDAGNCIEKKACSLPFSIYEIDQDSFQLKSEYSFNKTVFGLPTIAVPISNKVYMGSFHSDRLGYFIKK